jgi:hypothetical protein
LRTDAGNSQAGNETASPRSHALDHKPRPPGLSITESCRIES